MADTDVPSEPAFRANKRRKFFRKRRDSDTEEDSGTTQAEAGIGDDELERKTSGEVDGGERGVLRMQKRAGVRKHGIGFSSSAGSRATPQQENEETALVSITQDVEQEVQNDRFVKPTGREVVTEDKHMMAYVDSKLAEMRSAAASPANATSADNTASAPTMSIADEEGSAAALARPGERSFHLAQARSDRVYQRPTKRPRKKKYERDEADVARDAYIDQFMQEAQVPIYDRSTTKAAGAEADGDKDAAAAEAFKAQLLMDMELNRRRPPKSASAQAANATSGPKLGGSRQQREKMRAIQEAEGKK